MVALLAGLNICEQVCNFFDPYFKEEDHQLIFNYQDQGRPVANEYFNAEYNRLPSGPGIWLAGTVVPIMVRHLFLFHSAIEASCYCSLHPAWLARPGNCVFAALGLLPEPQQIGTLMPVYPNARLHFCFGNDLLAAILDCKMALWHKGMDTSFSISQDHVHWRWRGKVFHIEEQQFSFHRFQQECGMRTGIRTHKPPAGYDTFYDLLKQHTPFNL